MVQIKSEYQYEMLLKKNRRIDGYYTGKLGRAYSRKCFQSQRVSFRKKRTYPTGCQESTSKTKHQSVYYSSIKTQGL